MLVCNDSEDGESLFSDLFESNSEGQILPVNEWKNTLIGKWKCESVFTTADNTVLIENRMEFKSNGEYKAYFTYKYYVGRKIKSSNLHITEGGLHSGTWVVDTANANFYIIIEACEMSSSTKIDEGFYYSDICKNLYPNNSALSYGNLEDSDSIAELKIFSKNKILSIGRNFGDDTRFTIKFTRILD